MACKPKMEKKVDPFYIQQWWIITIMFILKAIFLQLILYGLLIAIVMTTVYAVRSIEFDILNFEDLLFYLSLILMKKMIITSSFRAILPRKRLFHHTWPAVFVWFPFIVSDIKYYGRGGCSFITDRYLVLGDVNAHFILKITLFLPQIGNILTFHARIFTSKNNYFSLPCMIPYLK